ncbi:hypothetical protein BC830DRAFT_240972 [Chytriomyces sp. MP71]|nr:hypothetical protein BC830DRAFT_240972 [Chytriomyces sp. MP71]
MPRNTVVYKLGAERNLEVATHNFPAQIKTHLRHAQHARQNCEWASFALHLSKAVALFAELGDNQKTVLHCNTLLDALALSRGAELSVREVPKCRVKGEAGARYMAECGFRFRNLTRSLSSFFFFIVARFFIWGMLTWVSTNTMKPFGSLTNWGNMRVNL